MTLNRILAAKHESGQASVLIHRTPGSAKGMLQPFERRPDWDLKEVLSRLTTWPSKFLALERPYSDIWPALTRIFEALVGPVQIVKLLTYEQG